MFLPDHAIAGIPCCIQRRPPEKWRKGQFSPLLLQGCMQAQPRHIILNMERAYKRSEICTLFASYALTMAAFCNSHYRYKSSARSVICFQKLIKLFVHNPNDLLTFSRVFQMFLFAKKLKKWAITSFPFGENSNFAGVWHAWVNKPIKAE